MLFRLPNEKEINKWRLAIEKRDLAIKLAEYRQWEKAARFPLPLNSTGPKRMIKKGLPTKWPVIMGGRS